MHGCDDRHEKPVKGSGGLTPNEKIDVCRGLFAYLVVVAHGLEVACGGPPRWHGTAPPGAAPLDELPGSGLYWPRAFHQWILYSFVDDAIVAGRPFPAWAPIPWPATCAYFSQHYVALLFAIVAEWSTKPGLAADLGERPERRRDHQSTGRRAEPDADLRLIRPVVEHHKRGRLLPTLRVAGVRAGEVARPTRSDRAGPVRSADLRALARNSRGRSFAVPVERGDAVRPGRQLVPAAA